MAEPVTNIGRATVVKGKLEGDENLVVEGRIEGSISLSKTLTIETSGVVQAEISVQEAIIRGVLERKSPPRAILPPSLISPCSIRNRTNPLVFMEHSKSVMSVTNARNPLVPNRKGLNLSAIVPCSFISEPLCFHVV